MDLLEQGSFDVGGVNHMLGFDSYHQELTALNGSAWSCYPNTTQATSFRGVLDYAMETSAPSSTAFPLLSTLGSTYVGSPFADHSSPDTSSIIDGVPDSTPNLKGWTMLLIPKHAFGPDAEGYSEFASASSASTYPSHPSPIVQSSPTRPNTPSPVGGHSCKGSRVIGTRKYNARELKPIRITEEDSQIDAKRKKNTQSARRSRQKRIKFIQSLEAELQRLRGILLDLGQNPDAGSLLNRDLKF